VSRRCLAAAAALPFTFALASCALAGAEGASTRYKAVEIQSLIDPPTWGILERDGANRPVDRYLSSLCGGEAGTGVIASPSFSISADAVQFTICGHDGQGGGAGRNSIALVDAATGKALLETPAPGSDSLQVRSWDVKALRGRKVRIEVRDDMAAGAFAWLGVGKIDAGPELKVDFKEGLPGGWTTASRPRKAKAVEVKGGVPFLDHRRTIVPPSGEVKIPCGFEAKRIFLLGCTVGSGKPLEERGGVTIVYKEGPPERYPLIVGFTLELEFKLLSGSKAMQLHPSGDPFLYYLAIAPRAGSIERIELRCAPSGSSPPLISGITFETGAASEGLQPLPACEPGPEESSWIESHELSAGRPSLPEILAEVKRVNKM